MALKRPIPKKTPRARAAALDVGACRIESLVTVDDRGQMVLPKEVRERAGLRGGDKLAVIICESRGRVSSITLVKTEQLGAVVKGVLGPLFKGLSGA